MIDALIYLLDGVTMLVLVVFLLRFWMPLLRVDFRNPVAQGILRITSPVIVPVRRVIPSIGRIDTATVLVAFAIQCLSVWIAMLLIGMPIRPLFIAVASIFELATLSVGIFMFVIFIGIVLSWLAPPTYNPVVAIVQSMSEPLLRPFRRLIPPMGGLDLSPVVPLLLLGALRILLAHWQEQLLRLM